MPRRSGEFPNSRPCSRTMPIRKWKITLIGTALVTATHRGWRLPDRVEVRPMAFAGRNNSTGDDVVAVIKEPGEQARDAVRMSTGAGHEGHEKQMVAASRVGIISTPTNRIQAVVGGGDPLTELTPGRSAGALLHGGGS